MIILGLFWYVPAFSHTFWALTTFITQIIGVPIVSIMFGSMMFHHPLNRFIIFLALLAICWLVKYSEKLQWYDEGNLWSIFRQQFNRSSRRQVAQSSPKPRLPQHPPRCNPSKGFWEKTQLKPLQRQPLNRVQYRTDVAERLLALERAKHPNKSEKWYLEKVIYDLRRGR